MHHIVVLGVAVLAVVQPTRDPTPAVEELGQEVVWIKAVGRAPPGHAD